MEKYTKINSNIRLFYIPFKKLKTVNIGIYIHRRITPEEASYNALLPYVLKSGCKKCPDKEAVARYCEGLYGAAVRASIIKFGEDQIMRFESDVINDCYAPEKEPLVSDAAELLLSILFEPLTEDGAFLKSVTEREKISAKDRINAMQNDKRSYASKRCMEEMCKGGNAGLSLLGTIDGIDKITPKSLYEYYSEMITSSYIDIYVCGDTDTDSIAKKVTEKISGISFKEAKMPYSEILETSGEVKEVTDKMDVVQGKLSMGFTTGIKPTDKDYPALQVMNSVFGAGAHSKLFNNVREKLSLAYYASSQLERYNGCMIVNSGIEFKNFQKAYDEILVQLENIKKGDISDLEFESSINAIINNYESYKDDERAMQIFALGEDLAKTGMDIEERKKLIMSVTKEDVARAAKNIKLDTVYFLDGKGESK